MTRLRQFLSPGMRLGVLTAAIAAGCAAPEPLTREVDSDADSHIKSMCKLLDSAKAFRFQVQATMDRPVDTGQLAQFHRTSDITVVRPDRLFANTESDEGSWSVWYRGKLLTILDRDENTYATETVPDRIGEMLDYLADEHDIVMPMADLLVGGTYESLLAEVEVGEYVGLHSVADTPCHHLLFHQENLEWQIWIDAGQQPLPRKLVITYFDEPDEPQYVATMDKWELAPTWSEETFTFTPPNGAASVSLSDLVASTEED
ncbi:MAG TPA: DUF2092 domain-containing protein [Phycisphaerae bacterium]|nr:DUF2092 domain-containing protein [Phycisphaerae bacterium]